MGRRVRSLGCGERERRGRVGARGSMVLKLKADGGLEANGGGGDHGWVLKELIPSAQEHTFLLDLLSHAARTPAHLHARESRPLSPRRS